MRHLGKIGRILTAGFMAGVLAGTLAGCEKAPEVSEVNTALEEVIDGAIEMGEDHAPQREYHLVFSQCMSGSAFYDTMTREMEDYAEQRGLQIRVRNAQGNPDQQSADVDQMINEQNTDAVIINPISNETVAMPIQECIDFGIPVFTMDRSTDNENVSARVVTDDYNMGVAVGQKLLEDTGGESAAGVILEIQGPEGNPSLLNRRAGFESVFTAIDGITIVRTAYCGFDRESARQVAAQLIANNPEILAIYGLTDDLALGALDALEEAGMSDTFVCGIDGRMEACEDIVDGKFLCTAAADPVEMAHAVIENVIAYLNGQEFDQEIVMPVILIEPENAASYLCEGQEFVCGRELKASKPEGTADEGSEVDPEEEEAEDEAPGEAAAK